MSELITARYLAEKDPNYQDFIMFHSPVKFDEYWKNKDFYKVIIHIIIQTNDKENSYLTSAGKFAWKHNKLNPLDYDSYSKNMTVFGFKEFKTEGNKNGLSIIVGNDW